MIETIHTTSRLERIRIIRERDGVLCFHPDCRKPFKFLTHDFNLVPENLPLLEDITFDHWYPRSLGGTWDVENLRLMHKRCNALKGDKVPNEDGSVPGPRNEMNADARRALKKSQRAKVCPQCLSGRALEYGDQCETCGSGPMPLRYPQWARMPAGQCDHDLFWCWACSIGITDRPSAISRVLSADELDE